MKYSVSWLNELAGTQLSVDEMADRFTRRSFEVEEIIRGNSVPEGVFVGKILEVFKHPNADNLSLTKVTIDPEEKMVLDIVCGAKNIAVGDIVPVATVGTKLGENFVIQEAKIRGEFSRGMICAEDELGLGKDHSGILHLPKDLTLGTPLSEIFPKADDVIDLDILASRGHDALSHIGIARELIAIENTNTKLNLSRYEISEVNQEMNIEVEDERMCPRYMGALIEGIDNTVKTPDWLVSRLTLCGVGSINVVTDITNYVMLELGQPMHAFDFSKIKDKSPEFSLNVRKAKKGEKLELLDGKMIELDINDIVIASKDTALALAGIMGGIESATDNATSSVFLESACFEPHTIRSSRMRHKIVTESSYRFERDIDPNLAEIALARALELFREILGVEGVCVSNRYAQKTLPWEVEVAFSEVRKLLGTSIENGEILDIVRRLDFGVKEEDKETFFVTIPTIRRDIRTQEDVIEEIGRMYGYENVEPLPLEVPLQASQSMKTRDFVYSIKENFVDFGYDELFTYSFYGQYVIDMLSLDADAHFSLKNPLNEDQKYFRTRLLPNLLKATAKVDRRFEDIRLFEMGSLYERGELGQVERFDGIAVVSSTRKKVSIKEKLFETKGDIEALLKKLIGEKPLFEAIDKEERIEVFHPTQTMDISLGGVIVGFLGTLHPFVAKKLKLPKTTIVGFLNRKALEMLWEDRDYTYKTISPFPWVFRDISLNVGKDIRAQEVEEIIEEGGGEVLRLVEIFDIYEKDGEKSFAYHLAFGSDEKTLSGEFVDNLIENIHKTLQEKLQVTPKTERL